MAPVNSTVPGAGGGFTLVNATPAIIGWTTPADGNTHVVQVSGALVVTTLEVGGAISITYTSGGVAITQALFASAQAAGNFTASFAVTCDPNTTVTITQSAALTSGAAKVWASLTPL